MRCGSKFLIVVSNPLLQIPECAADTSRGRQIAKGGEK